MKSTRNDHRSTVLLAGFAAFPGAPANPAERLVGDMSAVSRVGSHRLERLVLPVEWDRSWRVLATAIRRTEPKAVLLVGLHAGAERFRLEMLAFNERHLDRPDAAGRLANAAAIDAGPPSVEARLPLAAVEFELAKAGVDFELSRDPGRYLCNETLYRLCRSADAFGIRHFGFVHTPLTDECAAEARRMGFETSGRRRVRSADLTLTIASIMNVLAGCLVADEGAASA